VYIQEILVTLPGRKAAAPSAVSRKVGKDSKKAKSYRLSENKIAAAQEILGAKTATATIEIALDMVVFRKELVDGTALLLGLDVDTIYSR